MMRIVQNLNRISCVTFSEMLRMAAEAQGRELAPGEVEAFMEQAHRDVFIVLIVFVVLALFVIYVIRHPESRPAQWLIEMYGDEADDPSEDDLQQ